MVSPYLFNHDKTQSKRRRTNGIRITLPVEKVLADFHALSHGYY